VYHYTKASTALDHILKNGTLQFGAYTNSNDPKETKPWEFYILSLENRDVGKYEPSTISPRFSNELKATAKVACFSTDKAPLSGDHMKDIYRRGFAKARMWAQYADKHTGVCLVFDRAKLLKAVERHFGQYALHHGYVTYHDAPLVRDINPHEFMINLDLYASLGPQEYARLHIERHHRALFFEKLADWRDEAEWRILLLTDTLESIYLPFDDSLVGVMHGDATDPDTSELIMSLTKSSKVEHMGIGWKNSTPWYDYGSFRWIPGKITRPRRQLPKEHNALIQLATKWTMYLRTQWTRIKAYLKFPI
jgi:hypothetical protein